MTIEAAKVAIREALNPKWNYYKPTPGPWFAHFNCVTEDKEYGSRRILNSSGTRGKTEAEEANNKYIAACNPENITAILDHSDSLSKQLFEQAEKMATLQKDLDTILVAEFAAQSASRHLSSLLDFERQVSDRCMAVMKSLMDAAEPVNNEFQDCHIDYAEYAKFVDAHAELLYVRANGERPPEALKGATP